LRCLLDQLATYPQAPPVDAGPTPTSAPLIHVESLQSGRTSLRREVILVSPGDEKENDVPKDKGKVCADVEVEMEIAQDEQAFREEDRARSSNSNEGRIFDSIPEHLFLRPRPCYANPTNATVLHPSDTPSKVHTDVSEEPPPCSHPL
jgi:hypothetical protein